MPRRLNPTPAAVNAFQRALPRWYRRHKRDLPWRRTRDPYKIWVSEIMLQQTRVDVVKDYYRRWLQAFPTIASLARARYSRVLKMWEGLGYYQRAKNLHRAARTARRSVPTSYAELQKLPGIGRYTAAAIASIAFGERVPVVDGNVARVLARVFCIRDNIRQPGTLAKLFALAESLMPAAAPGDFNQAMMELGALVCTPARPRCGQCPLRRVCRGRARADELPNRGARPRSVPVTETAAWVCRESKILLRRRPRTGLLAGMWELPALDETNFRPGKQLLVIRHTIMNRRLTLRVVACGLRGAAPADDRWVSRRELSRLALPAAQRRAVEAIRF